eukprot:TRINITY_DN7243_c0_g1_i11.p1 TRINITY_DN7243_c0_g1~~TRINITY_DN7243_c0_g1_i11.p1  ORF type:complete len:1023 (+),score=239.10 TRINITY_DN7243_c0_g1_i11:112-3180(+)
MCGSDDVASEEDWSDKQTPKTVRKPSYGQLRDGRPAFSSGKRRNAPEVVVQLDGILRTTSLTSSNLVKQPSMELVSARYGVNTQIVISGSRSPSTTGSPISSNFPLLPERRSRDKQADSGANDPKSADILSKIAPGLPGLDSRPKSTLDALKEENIPRRERRMSFASAKLMGFDDDAGDSSQVHSGDHADGIPDHMKRRDRVAQSPKMSGKAFVYDYARPSYLEDSPASPYIMDLISGASSEREFAARMEFLPPEARRSIIEDFASVFKRVNKLLQVTNKGLAIAAELNPDKAREKIAQEVSQFLLSERALFYEIDDVKKDLVTIDTAMDDKEIRLEIGQGLAGHTVELGKSINIPMAGKDTRFINEIEPVPGSELTSIISTPVKDPVSGKVVGVVQAINKMTQEGFPSSHGFSNLDDQCLQIIASQTGILLRNAKLYKASVTTQHRISVILELSRQLSSELNLKSLCRVIMQKARELLKADRCTLFLVDQERKELWSQVAEGAAEIRFPMNLGIAGHVATSGETLNIPEAYEDSRFNSEIDRKTGYRTKTILCMPIINPMQQKIVGVTQMINKLSGQRFDEVDEDLLQAFSAQAGVAIENSISFGESIKARTHLQQVLGSITSLVLNIKGDGKLFHSNKPSNVLLGVDEETMRKTTYVEWMGIANKVMMDDITTVLSIQQPVNSGDYIYTVPNQSGVTKTITYSAVPLQNKEDGIVLIVNDITHETKLKNTLSRYMSPALAQEVMKDGDLKLGGKSQKVTIVFSDIRKFTTLSEGMTATKVVDMLNEYFSSMVQEVFNENGVLDKYIGDALMAVWGVPVTHNDDAIRACRTAVKMMEALHILNDLRASRGELPIKIGIGLNTGMVVSGNIGSEKRLEYTVIGDGVNLASRIEGATKYYGVSILISEFTYQELMDHGQAEEFIVRDVDMVRVVGKKQPIRIYELMGSLDHPPSVNRQQIRELFGQGLELYRSSRFDEAIPYFKDGLDIEYDKPCEMFLHRCNAFMETPPPSDWEGVWDMDEK